MWKSWPWICNNWCNVPSCLPWVFTTRERYLFITLHCMIHQRQTSTATYGMRLNGAWFWLIFHYCCGLVVNIARSRWTSRWSLGGIACGSSWFMWSVCPILGSRWTSERSLWGTACVPSRFRWLVEDNAVSRWTSECLPAYPHGSRGRWATLPDCDSQSSGGVPISSSCSKQLNKQEKLM